MIDPITNALLRSWGWRVDVLLLSLLLGLFYTRGWWLLWGKGYRLASRQRLVSYWVGIGAIWLGLMSPIDVLAQNLFYFHMIQHLLLMMVAPVFLWLAEPFPIGVWGMPAFFRPFVVSLFTKNAPTRRIFLKLTSPMIIWLLFTFFLIGWHDPNAYNAALEVEWLHDLEHLTFFVPALIYWWRIIGAAPILTKRLSSLTRIALALAAVPPNAILGATIAFASEPIYSYYLTVPRLFGMTALEDQQIGGFIMWVPGSMMYIIAALIVVFRQFQAEERQPASSLPHWDTTEKLIAPGMDAQK